MTDENSRGVETRWQKEKGFYLSKVESLYNIKRGDKGNFICVLGKLLQLLQGGWFRVDQDWS